MYFPDALLQFLRGIPKELEEAATIDGSGFLKTYSSIMFPLAKPIMATVLSCSLYGPGILPFAVDCYAEQTGAEDAGGWPVCP